MWVLLFSLGIGYQTFRERSAPPFYPPNPASLRSVLNGLRLLQEKAHSCFCRTPADDESLFEDRPSVCARIAALCSSQRGERERLSAYESFPRIGSDEGGASFREAALRPLKRLRGSLRQLATRLREKVRTRESPLEECDDVGPITAPAETFGGVAGGERSSRETDYLAPK